MEALEGSTQSETARAERGPSSEFLHVQHCTGNHHPDSPSDHSPPTPLRQCHHHLLRSALRFLKIVHLEAHLPLSVPQRADAPPVTPSTSRRKSTLKDRTPRQVQQLLSARKLQQTQKSSAKKPSDRRRTTLLGGAGTNMNHTPANLLRALSRSE